MWIMRLSQGVELYLALNAVSSLCDVCECWNQACGSVGFQSSVRNGTSLWIIQSLSYTPLLSWWRNYFEQMERSDTGEMCASDASHAHSTQQG